MNPKSSSPTRVHRSVFHVLHVPQQWEAGPWKHPANMTCNEHYSFLGTKRNWGISGPDAERAAREVAVIQRLAWLRRIAGAHAC